MSIYSEESYRSFEKLFKVVENYLETFIEECKQKSKHCKQDLLGVESAIRVMVYNLKDLKEEFSMSNPPQKLKKISTIIPRYMEQLTSENKELKKKLEIQINLNRLYRLGYELDFRVYLSTFLWISSLNYESKSERDTLIKKFPKEILKIVGDYVGIIWKTNI